MRLVILALYLVLALSLSACDWFDDDDDDNSGGAGEVVAVDQTYTGTSQAEPAAEAAEETTTEDVSTDDVEYTTNYHHWNPRSWEGRGSSIVLCPGAPKYDSCELDGRSLRLHGSRDYGRWIWTDYNTRGLSGRITCRKGSETVGFKVSSSSSTQYGNC